MKKIILIIIALVWISALIILIISLTDIYPNTIFKEHRSVVGIGFIVVSGLLKLIYNSFINKNKNVTLN
ncbi:hypothetical protein LX77_00948 [Gelidibacter algens]|uniref:Uncharacterized protein n=1 Tax=Gelidibacter algens TaxID=49280 RepID=A0A327SGA8_9FLAO|nr:hypothetical protein LX77_00948 [Gelidibacter algens]